VSCEKELYHYHKSIVSQRLLLVLGTTYNDTIISSRSIFRRVGVVSLVAVALAALSGIRQYHNKRHMNKRMMIGRSIMDISALSTSSLYWSLFLLKRPLSNGHVESRFIQVAIKKFWVICSWARLFLVLCVDKDGWMQ
jgi:hypothetical protein